MLFLLFEKEEDDRLQVVLARSVTTVYEGKTLGVNKSEDDQRAQNCSAHWSYWN